MILAQLFAYLGLLYRLPRRRLLAILLSPLAVGVMFVFARGPVEGAIVVLAGASYGASVWFPLGPPAWWQTRPRLVAVAAATWLAATVAVGLVQPLSAGVRTDVQVTIEDANRTANYRLACDYDRAGRVRGHVRVARAHPGGDRACALLDYAARSLEEGPSYLQRACPGDAPTGFFRGRVRGRPFAEHIVGAECDETAFVPGEAHVLVPPVRQ